MYGDRKTLGERLDDMAKGSGFYAVTMIDRPEPRNLRFLPALNLAASLIGYILICVPMGAMRGTSLLVLFWVGVGGALLFWGGLMGASYMRFMGPRIFPDPAHPLDERERALRARAGSISGGIVTGLAMTGCFYLGFAQFFSWWMPTKLFEWTYLALLVQTWSFTLPVLVASWLQPADSVEPE